MSRFNVPNEVAAGVRLWKHFIQNRPPNTARTRTRNNPVHRRNLRSPTKQDLRGDP